jgi:hypothetical protein
MFDLTLLEEECMKTILMVTWKGNGKRLVVVID